MRAMDLVGTYGLHSETEAWRAALAEAVRLRGSRLRREAQAAFQRADRIASRIAHRAAVRARAAAASARAASCRRRSLSKTTRRPVAARGRRARRAPRGGTRAGPSAGSDGEGPDGASSRDRGANGESRRLGRRPVFAATSARRTHLSASNRDDATDLGGAS